MKTDKISKRWEIGFLIVYGLILIHDFLDTTMFIDKWPPKFGLIFYALIAFYTTAKIFFNRKKFTKLEYIKFGVLLIVFVSAGLLSGYSVLLEIGLLIIGAANVSVDKILRVYFWVGFVVVTAAFFASQYGIIDNLVYEIIGKGTRNSFGIIYPTDCAAHIFFLIVVGLCIQNRIVTIADILLTIFFAQFVLAENVSYTSWACLVMLTVLIIFEKFYEYSKSYEKMAIGTMQYREFFDIRKNTIFKLMSLMPIVMTILITVLTVGFNKNSPKWAALDTKLSSRLTYSSQGLKKFGLKPFGQYIKEWGFGKSTAYHEKYFFLDDSYIRIMLMYGVVMLIAVLVMWVVISKKALETKRLVLLVAVAVIAVQCFMEHHMLEMAYNPLFLLLFADFTCKERKKSIFLLKTDSGNII